MSIGADMGTVCMRMYVGVVLHACENMGQAPWGQDEKRVCQPLTPRSQGRTCEGPQLWPESRREKGTNMPAAQPILTVVGETALMLGKPKALRWAC